MLADIITLPEGIFDATQRRCTHFWSSLSCEADRLGVACLTVPFPTKAPQATAAKQTSPQSSSLVLTSMSLSDSNDSSVVSSDIDVSADSTVKAFGFFSPCATSFYFTGNARTVGHFQRYHIVESGWVLHRDTVKLFEDPNLLAHLGAQFVELRLLQCTTTMSTAQHVAVRMIVLCRIPRHKNNVPDNSAPPNRRPLIAIAEFQIRRTDNEMTLASCTKPSHARYEWLDESLLSQSSWVSPVADESHRHPSAPVEFLDQLLTMTNNHTLRSWRIRRASRQYCPDTDTHEWILWTQCATQPTEWQQYMWRPIDMGDDVEGNDNLIVVVACTSGPTACCTVGSMTPLMLNVTHPADFDLVLGVETQACILQDNRDHPYRFALASGEAHLLVNSNDALTSSHTSSMRMLVNLQKPIDDEVDDSRCDIIHDMTPMNILTTLQDASASSWVGKPHKHLPRQLLQEWRATMMSLEGDKDALMMSSCEFLDTTLSMLSDAGHDDVGLNVACAVVMSGGERELNRAVDANTPLWELGSLVLPCLLHASRNTTALHKQVETLQALLLWIGVASDVQSLPSSHLVLYRDVTTWLRCGGGSYHGTAIGMEAMLGAMAALYKAAGGLLRQALHPTSHFVCTYTIISDGTTVLPLYDIARLLHTADNATPCNVDVPTLHVASLSWDHIASAYPFIAIGALESFRLIYQSSCSGGDGDHLGIRTLMELLVDVCESCGAFCHKVAHHLLLWCTPSDRWASLPGRQLMGGIARGVPRSQRFMTTVGDHNIKRPSQVPELLCGALLGEYSRLVLALGSSGASSPHLGARLTMVKELLLGIFDDAADQEEQCISLASRSLGHAVTDVGSEEVLRLRCVDFLLTDVHAICDTSIDHPAALSFVSHLSSLCNGGNGAHDSDASDSCVRRFVGAVNDLQLRTGMSLGRLWSITLHVHAYDVKKDTPPFVEDEVSAAVVTSLHAYVAHSALHSDESLLRGQMIWLTRTLERVTPREFLRRVGAASIVCDITGVVVESVDDLMHDEFRELMPELSESAPFVDALDAPLLASLVRQTVVEPAVEDLLRATLRQRSYEDATEFVEPIVWALCIDALCSLPSVRDGLNNDDLSRSQLLQGLSAVLTPLLKVHAARDRFEWLLSSSPIQPRDASFLQAKMAVCRYMGGSQHYPTTSSLVTLPNLPMVAPTLSKELEHCIIQDVRSTVVVPEPPVIPMEVEARKSSTTTPASLYASIVNDEREDRTIIEATHHHEYRQTVSSFAAHVLTPALGLYKAARLSATLASAYWCEAHVLYQELLMSTAYMEGSKAMLPLLHRAGLERDVLSTKIIGMDAACIEERQQLWQVALATRNCLHIQFVDRLRMVDDEVHRRNSLLSEASQCWKSLIESSIDEQQERESRQLRTQQRHTLDQRRFLTAHLRQYFENVRDDWMSCSMLTFHLATLEMVWRHEALLQDIGQQLSNIAMAMHATPSHSPSVPLQPFGWDDNSDIDFDEPIDNAAKSTTQYHEELQGTDPHNRSGWEDDDLFEQDFFDMDHNTTDSPKQGTQNEYLEQQRLEQQRLELERLEQERLEQQRLEQQRLEQQRLELERLEQQRLEAERLEQQRIEQQRLELERLEQQRLEAERLEQQRREQVRLEQERLELERLEQQRLEQQRIEQQRLEAQRLEQQRHEQERLEQQRLELERLEQQRLELERLEQERLEQQRLEAQRLEQQRHEQERLEQERLEQQRLEAQRLEQQRIEQQRLEVERLEQERLEQQRLEQQRLALERLEQQRLEAERLEQQRLELERLEQQRLEAQRLEQQRIEQQRLEAQRLEQQRLELGGLEQQRLEAERLEQQRIEVGRLEQQRLEQQRLELERLEQQRLEQQRLEQQRLEQQRLEQQRLALERLEQQRLEAERLEQQRLEAERLEQQRIEQQRLEQQRLALERLEQQRLEAERLEQQRHEQERLEQERLEQQRLEQQRLELERLEQQRLEAERLEQQRLEQQRRELERLEQQRLEQQRIEQQRLEQQRLEQQRPEREYERHVQEMYSPTKTAGWDDDDDLFANEATSLGHVVVPEVEQPLRAATASGWTCDDDLFEDEFFASAPEPVTQALHASLYADMLEDVMVERDAAESEEMVARAKIRRLFDVACARVRR